jgi:hypothetical protein
MGKASSNKKVARAASTGGGRTARGRTPWLWWSVISLCVLLGVSGVVFSRNQRLEKLSASGVKEAPFPPSNGKQGDHWHTAYGVYLCDHFAEPITDQRDPNGIHTHGDGVIHVHPYVPRAAGKNANLGQFADAVKMTLNAGELKLSGGHDYREGDKCNGKAGRVRIHVFTNEADTTGHDVTGDPRSVRMQDNELIVIAFAPPGATLPQPPSTPNLKKLNDVPAPTTTTVPGATPDATPSTTAPAAPTTTAPPASTTTAKP